MTRGRSKRLREIGARFREARGALGMTMRQVADVSGLSCGFICQVENGTGISLDYAVKLAAIYGVPLNWLATGGALAERGPR